MFDPKNIFAPISESVPNAPSIYEIFEKINTLSVKCFSHTNANERKNAAREITNLTTKLIQLFRSGIEAELNQKTISEIKNLYYKN